MPDTTLVLGDFEFGRFEIPEQIAFGGEQQLVVHELVGGVRVIDAMGERPLALEWSGVFVGSAALDRALYLDGLRKAGNALELTWSQLNYRVVIRSMRCTFQRFYRLPYSITCEVVADQTTPVRSIADVSPEQMVGDDFAEASDIADRIDDDTLSARMVDLSAAFAAARPIAQMSASRREAVFGPLAAVRARVGAMLNTTGLDLGATSVAAGAPLATAIGVLAAQVAASAQASDLVALDRTLGRLQANLSSLGSGTSTLDAAGGNLFDIAAERYGDARGWSVIAQANGLTDPQLSGLNRLSIPPLPAGADGILNG